MRSPVRAAGLPHVLLVCLIVALEPANTAVALEHEQVRGEAVEEPAIVADDRHASGEVKDGLLERAERVDVEVVRGLVEEQDVATGAQKLREMDPVTFATGEIADLLLLIGAPEVDRRGVGPRVPRPRTDLDVLFSPGDLLPHVLVRIERVAGLRDVRELHRFAHLERPAIRPLLAGDEAEERRLPSAVGSDDPDDAAARQREGQIVEEELLAVGLAQPAGLDHELTEPWAGRDRDLELEIGRASCRERV